MAQAGLHAALGYQLRRLVPLEKRLLPAVIFGSILPDLDIIAVAVGSLFYSIPKSEAIFHRTFSHSFFTIILVYLLFSTLSEWKKRPIYKLIGKGLVLGILSHIIIDTFFWFRTIQFLWPLPLAPFNFWSFWEAPNWLHRTLLILEFFCFYWYAWFLITKHINFPNQHSWVIKYLQIWKKWEGILFICFILLAIWTPNNFIVLFGAAYIPSLIITLWVTYISRDALESDPFIINEGSNE